MNKKHIFKNSLIGKKILVTGGLGFIGKNLIESLPNSCEITILDIRKPKSYELDWINKFNIKLITSDIVNEKWIDYVDNVDFIFHFAAKVGVDYVSNHRSETVQTEIIGMYNVLKFIEKNLASGHVFNKIIFSSTSSVYGRINLIEESKESRKLKPREDYAKAKVVAESYLKSFCKKNNIKYSIFRLFNIYGAYQKKEMVVQKFIQLALKNSDIVVYDNGNQTRDFTYVEDVVHILKLSILNDIFNNDVFNIGRGVLVKIKDLALKIIELTNSESKIIYRPTPNNRKDFEVVNRVANNVKLKTKININFKNLNYGLKKICKFNNN